MNKHNETIAGLRTSRPARQAGCDVRVTFHVARTADHEQAGRSIFEAIRDGLDLSGLEDDLASVVLLRYVESIRRS